MFGKEVSFAYMHSSGYFAVEIKDKQYGEYSSCYVGFFLKI